jgi:hypothetical protein
MDVKCGCTPNVTKFLETISRFIHYLILQYCRFAVFKVDKVAFCVLLMVIFCFIEGS